MIKALLSPYLPSYATIIVYMLQSTEYQSGAYLKWLWRTRNFTAVMKRRTLDRTRAARLLLLALRVGIFLQILTAGTLIIIGLRNSDTTLTVAGIVTLLLYPVVWSHLVVAPLILGRIFIVNPRQKAMIAKSKAIFAKHPGTTIAVAGSYGKTSMKELLAVILSEGKKIAVTPANKNVAISHAYFANKLEGNEDVLVLEYGESKPGDVRQFAQTTRPDIGIITGLAPAHLDQYASLKDAGQDIFSLADYLNDTNVYVNGDSEPSGEFIKPSHHIYSSTGMDDWKVSNIKVGLDGTKFDLTNSKKTLHLHTKLIGKHHVGPLTTAAVLALEMGLTEEQVQDGVAKTEPFEHRMQARNLHGAWIIDDTYNGNIDGMRAGLELLKELPAKRKMYVTPGLVDQGVETENVHVQLGRLIAEAAPDKVVLMKNSATDHIIKGMDDVGYAGELVIEDEPLNFYTNLEHVVAGGDVVLMQNDWTDNYS